jgi:hypothetical protein
MSGRRGRVENTRLKAESFGCSYAKRLRSAPYGDMSSWQDWEIEHLVDKLCRDFPGKSRAAIEKAVNACTKTVHASAGRERLIDCARRTLSH